jgi:hypothetical protein
MLHCGSQAIFVQCNMAGHDNEPLTPASVKALLRRIGARAVYLGETSVKSC